MQANEGAAELDHDPCIGRKKTLADDAADSALAADKNGLHVTAVLVQNEIGGQARPAGKMHDLDVVAGTVQHVVRSGFLVGQMRCEQRIIGDAEPPQ